ncbi:MAG: hypothetical protein ACETWM_20830 [Candidatus Lokiarchaeia archaeon]
MSSGLVIIRFKAIKDAEKLLVFLSRDNPGLLSDDTDGDLIIWSRTPIVISKMAVQYGYDDDENEELWTTFEPDIIRAEAIKREEETILVR